MIITLPKSRFAGAGLCRWLHQKTRKIWADPQKLPNYFLEWTLCSGTRLVDRFIGFFIRREGRGMTDVRAGIKQLVKLVASKNVLAVRAFAGAVPSECTWPRLLAPPPLLVWVFGAWASGGMVGWWLLL